MISAPCKLKSISDLPVEWMEPTACPVLWGWFGPVENHEIVGLDIFNAKAGVYILHADNLMRLLELGDYCVWLKTAHEAKEHAHGLGNWPWPSVDDVDPDTDAVTPRELHVPHVAGGEVW